MRWKGTRSSYEFRKRWEGILPLLERRYRDTSSDARRQELEKLMSTRPCAGCDGARLRPESLAVKIGGRNIAEQTASSVAASDRFFGELRLFRGFFHLVRDRRVGFLRKLVEFLTLA